MKLARITLAAALLSASFSSIPTAYADVKVAECAEFRNPTSSASATTITLKVDVYAKCTEAQLGRGKGQKPLYEMTDEESLFNLSSCNGPSITQLVGNGWLGTATCSLRIGSNTLPSSRVGATSTTMKMWFAWDSSSKTVSISHKAIPASTNNGWGGSGSGSTSGSTGGSNTPNTKNCISAPDTPTLAISWNDKGPLFKFSPSISGEKSTVLTWNFVLYDSLKGAWDSWGPWREIYPANSGEHQALPEANKTKIAFSVYSTNACGSSGSAREIPTKTGVALEPRVQDQIIALPLDAQRVKVGKALDVYSIASSKLGLSLTVTSESQSFCKTSGAGIVVFLAQGECKLQFTSTSYQNKVGAPPTSYSLNIRPQRIKQVIPELNLSTKYDISKSPLDLSLFSDAGLKVKFTALTDEVCFVAGDSLILRNGGTCELQAAQEGDDNTLAAESKFFNIQVAVNKTAVVCLKGKQSKKVTGFSPKCPAGYKLKK